MKVSYFLKNEIKRIMTKDSVERKNLHWNLITIDEAFRTIEMCFTVTNKSENTEAFMTFNYRNNLNVKLASYTKTYLEFYRSKESPVILNMIAKYKDCMAICGGSIIHRLYKDFTPSDIDIFLYGITSDKATEIVSECVAYLVKNAQGIKLKHRYIIYHPNHENTRVFVKRNMYTTTVCIEHMDNNGKYSLLGNEIQFIHRIYPRKDMIIGGFDLGCSAIMYDGENLLTTQLGAWCLVNSCIPIDITRRSTTFEYRIVKYMYNYGFGVLFPGLDPESDYKHNYKCDRDDLKYINKIIRDHGYRIAMSYNQDAVGFDYSCIKKEPSHILKAFDMDNSSITLKRENLKNGCSEKYLKHKSDYSYKRSLAYTLELNNSTSLICNNLEVVYSIVRFWDFDIITEKTSVNTKYGDCLARFRVSLNEPDIGGEEVFDVFERRLKKYDNPLLNDNYVDNNDDTYLKQRTTFVKLFGEDYVKFYEAFRNGVKISSMEEDIAILRKRLIENFDAVSQKLKGITWITESPTRQWTSSINPIITNPTDWYSEKYYRPFIIGLPKDVEIILRCLKKFRKSSFSLLNNDLLNIILRKLTYKWYEKNKFKFTNATSEQLKLLEQNCPKDLKDVIEKLFDCHI